MRIFPPAARILFLAVSVTLRAQTVSLGTTKSLSSLVMVEVETTIWFLAASGTFLTILLNERGNLLSLEEESLLRIF